MKALVSATAVGSGILVLVLHDRRRYRSLAWWRAALHIGRGAMEWPLWVVFPAFFLVGVPLVERDVRWGLMLVPLWLFVLLYLRAHPRTPYERLCEDLLLVGDPEATPEPPSHVHLVEQERTGDST